MKKLLLIPILFLFIGCSDDPIEDSLDESNLKREIPLKSDGSIAENKPVDADSAARYALLQYNKIKIYELGNEIIENLLRKNRRLEFSNQLVNQYGYSFSKDIRDSLNYYGFTDKEIGYGDANKDIDLIGQSPYLENGIWEKVMVKIKNFEAKHPVLYKQAIERFYEDNDPKIQEITISDRAGNVVDYCAKVRLNDGQEQYLCFSIETSNQKTIVTLKKD